MMLLRDYQNECVDAVFNGWQSRDRVAIEVATGAGKGHPLDTEVPTPEGLRLWGDLKPGDYVFGSDGSPTQVMEIYDRGVLDTYLVTTKHGQQIVVDGDHLWQVSRKGRKAQVVETQWLAKQPMQENDGGYRWSIPVTGVVKRAISSLPLDPFVVGVLIANGHLLKSVTSLSTPDRSVIERVRMHVTANELPWYPNRTCPTFSLPGLVKVTRDLGLRVRSVEKRIPRAYLEAAPSQRVALLEGLLTSDGSTRAGGRRSVQYSTISPGLAQDMVELITSLGGTCTIVRADRSHDLKPVEYTNNILLPIDVQGFHGTRKERADKPRKTFLPRECIVSVQPHLPLTIRCISVAAKNHLYLITRSHIVTHNTVIFSEVIKRTLAANPKAKIVLLAHRGELLRSGAKTIAAHCGIQVGIVDGQVAPALRKRHLKAQVVAINTATLGVSTKQRDTQGSRVSTVTELHKALGNVDLVILDECHRANTDTAMDCLTELGCFSGTRLLGVTATLFRTDSKMLTDVFEACVYKKTLVDLIEAGFLVDIVMKKAMIAGLDLTKVGVSRSMSIEDFNATDLDRVMEAAGAEGVIAEFAKRYTEDRRTLVFTPTVTSAERVKSSFNSVGLDATVVHGSMKPSDRAAALNNFEEGKVQYLINCMILTEGVDLPSCSCIIMARPTKSQQLYLQILGRSLRLSEDKENALIIDLVGATSINGLVNAENIFGVRDNEGIKDATERHAQIQATIQAKAQLVVAQLTPEEQEEYDLEKIVSGSFNLFDVEVEEIIAQVKHAAKESIERKERVRLRNLPSFPAPGRSGSMLELDFDFLVSLESWSTLPQYKGSYCCVVTIPGVGLVPFYCDKSRTFDKGRYGYIGNPVQTFEEAERAVIDFTTSFPGTAGAMYYSQNKLQANHPTRNKKPSVDQIKFMVNLLKRVGIKLDEVDALETKNVKQPNVGVVVDWIDFLILSPDARKQADSVREYFKDS